MLDRDVALKLIDSGDSDSSIDTRVVEEGRLMARIRHPNVVAIYGAQRIDGVTGLWMEFVEGRTLEAELADGGLFPAEAIVAVARQLGQALTAVHDAGLVHRDVKASNVLRDRSGRVVLGDFGTGRELEVADEPRQGLAGTPAYLAPEIFAHQPATPQSDLYSLGVLLFHLATGGYPVSGRSLREIKAAHGVGPAAAVHEQRPDLPARLCEVIDRLLSADPERRGNSARVVERALLPARRLKPVMVAAACGALLVVGLSQLPVWRSVDTPPPVVTPERPVDAAAEDARPAPAVAAAAAESAPVPRAGRTEPARVTSQSFGLSLRHLAPDLEKRVALRGASPDGRWIACQNSPPDVSLCDLTTGEVRVLKPAGSGEHAFAGRALLLSPDSRRLAYVWLSTQPGGVELTRIGVIDADGRNDRELYQGTSATLGSWTPDGKAIVAAAWTSDAQNRVLMLPLAGEPTELWRFSPGDTVFDLSPDGHTLAFTRVVTPTNQDIVVVDLATKKEFLLASGPVDDFWPLWTPDGKGIVYMSDRLGGFSLMLQRVEAAAGIGDAIVLRQFGRERTRPISFAPDGSLFAMITPAARTVFMTTVDLAQGTAVAAYAIDRSAIQDTMGADWSPDGDRIAYLRGQSGSAARSATVVVRGTASNITREFPVVNWLPGTGSQVRWSPDGKYLAAVYGGTIVNGVGQYTIDILDATTGNRREVISNAPVGLPRWDPAGGGLYYRRGVSVFRYDLSTNQSVQIHRLERGTAFSEAGFDVGVDGVLALAVRKAGMIGCDLSLLERSGAFTERHRFEEDCRAVAWTHDGGTFLMSTVAADGSASLWSLARSGGEPVRLPIEAPVFHSLSLSSDDRRLLFTAGSPRANLWKITGIPIAR